MYFLFFSCFFSSKLQHLKGSLPVIPFIFSMGESREGTGAVKPFWKGVFPWPTLTCVIHLTLSFPNWTTGGVLRAVQMFLSHYCSVIFVRGFLEQMFLLCVYTPLPTANTLTTQTADCLASVILIKGEKMLLIFFSECLVSPIPSSLALLTADVFSLRAF